MDAKAVVLGFAGGLLLAGSLLGAYALGEAGHGSVEAPRTGPPAAHPSPTGAAPDMLGMDHARAACEAQHRPNQIAFDNTRAVSDAEISAAFSDALDEAAVAASLDHRWMELRDGIERLQRVSTGAQGEDAFAEWQKWFAIVRAQCLLTGAGDINSASLTPVPVPSR